jgi:CRP/FNR family cyclic AMP-dependent transcriptional regulator
MSPDAHDASTKAKVDTLASMPLFKGSTPEELRMVAEVSVEATLPAGSILTYEDQVGGLVYILLEGSAQVTVRGTPVVTLGRGDVVGEMSLIDQGPRSAQVRAVTEVRVLEIDSDDFRGLMEKAPDFVRSLLRALVSRLRDSDANIPRS